MSRMLGSDLMRGLVDRKSARAELRPWESGLTWSRSSGLGGSGLGQMLAVPFEADEIEGNTFKGSNPAPFTSRGHTLDANTIGLWRFDDGLVDTRGTYTIVDSTNTAWTMQGGTPGFSSFAPFPGVYARKFSASLFGVVGEKIIIHRATSAALRTALQTSYSWDGWVKMEGVDTVSVWGHAGLSSSETAANNSIGQIVIISGYMTMFWEYGAGTNEPTITQTLGGPLVADTWYHLGCTKDTGTNEFKWYVNGEHVQTHAYTNDPTDGSSGALTIASPENSTSLNGGGNMSVKAMQWSSTVRGADWFAEQYRRMTTHGVMVRDASTIIALDLTDNPAAIDSSGYGHHLVSEGDTAANMTYPTVALVPDDQGRGRAFSECVMSTWYSPTIHAAMIADFTCEAWIQILAVPAAGHGLMHYGGDPASETQANNRLGFNISSGTMVITMENGAGLNSGGDVISPPGIIELGALYHVAVRKTMTGPTCTLALFLDGVKVAEETGVTNCDGMTNSEEVRFMVGGGCGVVGDISKFNGFMDDFRLSNIARTDEEIMESFESGVGGAHVEITSTPAVYSYSTSATFTFTSTIGDMEYSLDGAAYAPATSPLILAGLSIDDHTLVVRSVESPTTQQGFAWTVLSPITTPSGYFGMYFGAVPTVEAPEEVVVTPPTPVVAAITAADAEYTDHVDVALGRLPEFIKAKASDV